MNFEGAAIRLTDKDIVDAAELIDVEVAALKAVMDIEARGSGFDDKRRPTILFEPHVFYRELGVGSKRDQAVQKKVAARRWGAIKYPRTMDGRYRQLSDAMAIDKAAALKSASWGLGQVMGFNFEAAGFASVHALVNAMVQSERNQLFAMVEFIRSNGLDDALRRKAWAAFARGYNGAGYAKNKYDVKLAAAYKKRAAEKPAKDFTPRSKRNPTSPFLPLFRPKQDDRTTRAVLDHFKHLIPSRRRTDPVKVMAVRGYYLNSMGKKGKNDRGIYDDAFFVISPKGIQAFNGNSDPSAFRNRIATLKAPQSVEYRPGPHGFSRPGGPYPAFRQHSDVTVIRDGAGEDTDSPSKRFWINLHRGGTRGTSSAGCLTVPRHQWNEFRDLITGLLETYDQETFFVTLVEYPGDKPPVSIPAPASKPSPKTGEKRTQEPVPPIFPPPESVANGKGGIGLVGFVILIVGIFVGAILGVPIEDIISNLGGS